MHELSPQTVLRQTNRQLCAKLGEDLVALDTRSGSCSQLNTVGTAIWEKLRRPQSLRALLEALCVEYEGEPDVIRKEALDFVKQLLQKNILEIERERAQP